MDIQIGIVVARTLFFLAHQIVLTNIMVAQAATFPQWTGHGPAGPPIIGRFLSRTAMAMQGTALTRPGTSTIVSRRENTARGQGWATNEHPGVRRRPRLPAACRAAS